MFFRYLSIGLIILLITGCASGPSINNGYAAIETELFTSTQLITSVDGESTGRVFKSHSVYVLPGKHTIEDSIWCDGCSAQGVNKTIMEVDAGFRYVIPTQNRGSIQAYDINGNYSPTHSLRKASWTSKVYTRE